MLGLIQDRPLLISSLIEYAALYHGDTEIVTRTVEGPIHRYGYRGLRDRSKQLANALTKLGVKPGDRIGTLARSEEHTSELQSLMRISYAVFCLKKKKKTQLDYSTTKYFSHMNYAYVQK